MGSQVSRAGVVLGDKIERSEAEAGALLLQKEAVCAGEAGGALGVFDFPACQCRAGSVWVSKDRPSWESKQLLAGDWLWKLPSLVRKSWELLVIQPCTSEGTQRHLWMKRGAAQSLRCSVQLGQLQSLSCPASLGHCAAHPNCPAPPCLALPLGLPIPAPGGG